MNSARGDVGAFNLRSIGTGNTLVLLNGRRVVNAAGYQTEEVGGSFVPVNTANSNALPVYGIDRVEVLRDGASAIYGADAVAGVVNTVLKNDFEEKKGQECHQKVFPDLTSITSQVVLRQVFSR